MARVLVVGAQGVLGTFVAQAFREVGWDVVRAGRRREESADFLLLDLDDSAAVARAFGDADLIVNTAHHPGLSPERAALRGGKTLIDLAELSPAEGKSLERDAAGAEGVVVTGAGFSGVAYIAAADLLRTRPEADEAHYGLMFSAAGASGRAGALLGHALLTDTSHHRTRKIELPEPWGRHRFIEVNTGSARGILPVALNGASLRHYLSMQPGYLQSVFLGLNATRLISHLPAAMFTAGTDKEAPNEPSDEAICEWVAVSKGDRILAARTTEGKGYYRMTAAAIVTFGEELVRSPRPERGMRRIEELVALPEVLPSLERRKIAVRTQPVGPR